MGNTGEYAKQRYFSYLLSLCGGNFNYVIYNLKYKSLGNPLLRLFE